MYLFKLQCSLKLYGNYIYNLTIINLKLVVDLFYEFF